MERAEFDVWIETHYAELLKVARRRTNSDADARDVLQSAVATALVSDWYERSAKPWTRMVLAVRQAASNLGRGAERARSFQRHLKILSRSGASHGRRGTKPNAE